MKQPVNLLLQILDDAGLHFVDTTAELLLKFLVQVDVCKDYALCFLMCDGEPGASVGCEVGGLVRC